MARPVPSTAVADQVVLTAEGRRRLEERIQLAREQLSDVEQQLEGAQDDKDDLLAQRMRLKDRIGVLQSALAHSVSVGAVEEDPDIIELGDEVDVEFDDGECSRMVLVHPLEADATLEHVSIDAPLGRALLGRRVGDHVDVLAPAGRYRLRVTDRKRSR